MNGKKVLRSLVVGMALLAVAFLTPAVVLAHCDGMDGPVVKAAQKALAEGNVNLVLVWVQPGDEGAIKTAFPKTLAVRKLSPEARELADMYFFETLVRIHRAGEGAALYRAETRQPRSWHGHSGRRQVHCRWKG